MNPLNDLAPYPQTADEVTAENVAKNLALFAYANHWRGLDPGTSKTDQHEATAQVVHLYGIVKLLRTLIELDREQANTVARELWADWDAGDSLGEWLWTWLTEYGIDPAQVETAAQAIQRTKAA
jgi:hypothetical protein